MKSTTWSNDGQVWIGIVRNQRGKDKGILARAAPERVLAGSAIEPIVSRAAAENVVAVATLESVIAGITNEGVATRSTFEAIVTGLAEERIVARPADEPVVSACAFTGTGHIFVEHEVGRVQVGER